MIADRMDQYASGSAPDRREQARMLFCLHPALDLVYLERRIRDETIEEYGVDEL